MKSKYRCSRPECRKVWPTFKEASLCHDKQQPTYVHPGEGEDQPVELAAGFFSELAANEKIETETRDG